MKYLLLLSVVLPLQIVSSQQGIENAASILDRSRNLTTLEGVEATVTLTITDKNGGNRVRTNSLLSRSYPDGTEKRLIKFVSPAEVQGTSILIHDYSDRPDDMWIYLPALRKSRRIVSSEKGKSFMGSEFTNADMSSPPSADFLSRHLNGSGLNGTFIIESIPADESKVSEYGYSRKVSYIAAETYYIKKMEFWSSAGALIKVIEITGIEKIDQTGRYLVKKMTASNMVNGRSSSIVMENVTAGVKPADHLFDVQNLGR
jgi:hypothetical protein